MTAITDRQRYQLDNAPAIAAGICAAAAGNYRLPDIAPVTAKIAGQILDNIVGAGRDAGRAHVQDGKDQGLVKT